MIRAWSTDAVYAAEGALMATLDDGELMARAVEGLAGVAAARLEESGGESVAANVEALGITSLHLSLSHDAGIASAVVVAEGPDR